MIKGIDIWSFTPHNLQDELNGRKEQLLECLAAEGYLSKEDALYIAQRWTIIVSKPNWFANYGLNYVERARRITMYAWL